MKNRIGEQPISWTSLTWRNSLLFSTWISVDFAHALNIHASIKTELFMLVRMRYCPRINAPDTRWASANVTSNPYPLICREKKFFVSKKKKKKKRGKKKFERFRDDRNGGSTDRVSPMTRLNAASSTRPRRYSGRNAAESFLRRGTAACAPVKRPVNSRPGRFKVFINDAAAAPRVARHFLLFIQKRAAVEG